MIHDMQCVKNYVSLSTLPNTYQPTNQSTYLWTNYLPTAAYLQAKQPIYQTTDQPNTYLHPPTYQPSNLPSYPPIYPPTKYFKCSENSFGLTLGERTRAFGNGKLLKVDRKWSVDNVLFNDAVNC